MNTIFLRHLREAAMVALCSKLHYAPQGWREAERCQKVGHERQRSSEVNKSGGKVKKKWSKGKVRDQLNNLSLVWQSDVGHAL